MFKSGEWLRPSRALIVLGAAWVLGAGLLIASAVFGYQEDRFQHAPPCPTQEWPSEASCRVWLDGVITKLGDQQIEVRVQDRLVSAGTGVHRVRGNPGDSVKVLFYRGEMVRVQGGDTWVETDNSPAESHDTLRVFGLLALGVGTLGAWRRAFIERKGRSGRRHRRGVG